MRELTDFVSSGAAIDWILVLVLLEAVLLVGYRYYTRNGLGVGSVLSLLIPGACLLLALRCALTSAGAVAIGACLLAAFIAHLTDVMVRLRRA